LASSAIVDSIDLLPNPKPLNKFNVNALCSFHGCAAANPVPGIKMYNKYIPKVNLFPLLRFVPGDVFRAQQCTDQNQMVREGIQKYIDGRKPDYPEKTAGLSQITVVSN
jgi:hypothetical protein